MRARNLLCLICIAFTPIVAVAATDPLVIRRISATLGCAKFQTNGKFTLGTLSSGGIFRALSKKKLALNKYKRSAAVCKKLKGVGASLGNLPDTASFYQTDTSGSSAVSGVPPLLTSLNSGGGAAVFFRSGVLSRFASNSPTADDCEEFYGSALDGRSAGYMSCQVGDNIGQQLFVGRTVDNSTCYLRSSISSLTLGSGVSVTDGSLPSGGIDLLFDPPAGSSDRVVKISLTGLTNTIFFRISSASANVAAGNHYNVERWGCSSSGVDAYETLTVRRSDNLFTHTAKTNSFSGARLSIESSAYLVGSDGTLVPDTARERSVAVISTASGLAFSSALTVGSDNVFQQKIYSSIGTTINKSYERSEIGGSSTADYRLYQTAIAFQRTVGGAQVAAGVTSAEYQDTAYVSTASNALTAGLSGVDLSSDPHFASAPTITFDSSAYSCSETADVTLELDPTSTAVAAAIASCVPGPQPIIASCTTSDTINANLNYGSLCS